MTEQQKLEEILNKEDYENTITLLESYIEENPEELTYYWYLGLVYLLQKNEELAQEIWLSIFLQGNLEEVEQWTTQLINFLEIRVQEDITAKKLSNAKIIYEAIFIINPDHENLELLNNLVEALSLFASDLSFNKEYENALVVYLDALTLKPNHAISWHSLALTYYQLKQYSKAEEAIQNAIKLDNLSAQNYHVLGLILEKRNDIKSAIAAYNQAISHDLNFLDSYQAIGNLYFQLEDFDTAIKYYESLLKKSYHQGQPDIINRIEQLYSSDGNTKATRYLGYSAYLVDNYNKSIQYFEEYLKHEPGDVELDLDLGQSYVRTNRTQKAIQFIEQTLKLFPKNLSLKFFNQSILPIIFEKSEDIEFYRDRYASLLTELLENDLPHTLDEANEAFVGINKKNNFYLAYQGKNDLLIQQQYSAYLHSVLKIAYPQWSQAIKLSSDINQRKVRVGFVSQLLDGLGQLYAGWLKYSDKQKFEFYTYDLSKIDPNQPDKTRDQFKTYSHQIWYLGKDDNLVDLCEKISSDQLDILIMPEIAVSARVTPLSCLRLAPIQCTTWAHPVTSGSASIDYFLSSDLMEPPNGDEHYSETLVRLPNLAFPINQTELSPMDKQRSDFGIREDAIVYWCCQSLFKYLPQHDYIFPSIAQHSRDFQFIFIESDHDDIVTNMFKQRLKDSFAQFNLDSEQYCWFQPRLNKKDFSMITQLADVFLDCLSWSGGFTTKDAITCGLPVVTLPGEFMRARHSYGLLKMLGVTETIAQTPDEYIKIAVRLGLNAEWRNELRKQILMNNYRIFEDQDCIAALENFFFDAVNNRPVGI